MSVIGIVFKCDSTYYFQNKKTNDCFTLDADELNSLLLGDLPSSNKTTDPSSKSPIAIVYENNLFKFRDSSLLYVMVNELLEAFPKSFFSMVVKKIKASSVFQNVVNLKSFKNHLVITNTTTLTIFSLSDSKEVSYLTPDHIDSIIDPTLYDGKEGGRKIEVKLPIYSSDDKALRLLPSDKRISISIEELKKLSREVDPYEQRYLEEAIRILSKASS